MRIIKVDRCSRCPYRFVDAVVKAEAELELGNKAWEIKQKQLEEARAENLELGAELTSMLNDEIADGFDRNDIEKLQARAEKAEAALAVIRAALGEKK